MGGPTSKVRGRERRGGEGTGGEGRGGKERRWGEGKGMIGGGMIPGPWGERRPCATLLSDHGDKTNSDDHVTIGGPAGWLTG